MQTLQGIQAGCQRSPQTVTADGVNIWTLDKRTPDVCYSAMPLPRKRRPIGRILTSAIDALDTFSRVGQCQELKLAWASNATSMRRQNATVSSAKAATTITPGPDPAPVAV